VPVRDARPLIGRLSLDKEGFVLLQHQTAAKNLYDEDEITSVYYRECERVIKEATGAARVVAFDHIVRNAAMAALEGSCVRIPARVHVHLPTTDGRELVLTRYTELEPELSLLLKKLKLELPAQPPPKITATAPAPPTRCSADPSGVCLSNLKHLDP
jgi:hypothetical protein